MTQDYFEEMPNEMVYELVSWLKGKDLLNFTRVNKRFHLISKDEDHWNRQNKKLHEERYGQYIPPLPGDSKRIPPFEKYLMLTTGVEVPVYVFSSSYFNQISVINSLKPLPKVISGKKYVLLTEKERIHIKRQLEEIPSLMNFRGTIQIWDHDNNIIRVSRYSPPMGEDDIRDYSLKQIQNILREFDFDLDKYITL